MPLLIGREGSLAAVSSATTGTQELLLVTQRDADIQTPGSSNLHRIGVRARLLQVTRLAGGTTKILVEAVSRVSVQRYTSSRTSALLEARVTATAASVMACSYRCRTCCGSDPAMKAVAAAASATDSVV